VDDSLAALPSAPTTRFKLIIAYDGRLFRGWQSQMTGDAIQDRLEAAFFRLCGSRIVVHGSGRTDSGVHALAQVAHVDLPRKKLPPQKWLAALNAHLPPEVRVVKISRVPESFHARFSAKGKIYTYRICNAPVLPPLEIGRSWHLPAPLDLALLTQCAAKLVGTHDFAGFAANRGKPDQSSIRTLFELRVRRAGSIITLHVRGNGFLYKMVRLLTGSLVRCAQGRAHPDWLLSLLDAHGSLKSSFAAPAEGLYLTRVIY
jgi:tRNA pseudouridine38-40 synthase